MDHQESVSLVCDLHLDTLRLLGFVCANRDYYIFNMSLEVKNVINFIGTTKSASVSRSQEKMDSGGSIVLLE
jgi:hypothetical protein